MEVRHCSSDKINPNWGLWYLYIHILYKSVFELCWASQSVSHSSTWPLSTGGGGAAACAVLANQTISMLPRDWFTQHIHQMGYTTSFCWNEISQNVSARSIFFVQLCSSARNHENSYVYNSNICCNRCILSRWRNVFIYYTPLFSAVDRSPWHVSRSRYKMYWHSSFPIINFSLLD